MKIISKKAYVFIVAVIFTATMGFSLLALPSKAYADTYTDSDVVYTYTVGSGVAHVSGFTNTPIFITILETFEVDMQSYTVTSIEDGAFLECFSLLIITIPDSVTSIGNSAFKLCENLIGITIPDSVASIGASTFSYCSSLTSMTIPNSVTSIGASTFSHCSSLISIAIPDSVTSIGNHGFYGCTNLYTITIPDSIISIGEGVFEGCSKLATAYILGSPAIGTDAFNNSVATSGLITKPGSLSDYDFYKEAARTNKWIFDTDTRTGGDPTTVLYGKSNLSKADALLDSGIPGKGLENAPGQEKEFNPKSQAAENAGMKE